MMRDKAVALATTVDALWSSKKWGEVRSKVSPQVFQELLDLEDLDEAPDDEAPFEVGEIGAVCDGDWPEWPEQLMLSWVPREILREFGNAESSVLNGPFVALDVTREIEIVAAFERLGFCCVRDERLIARCRGD